MHQIITMEESLRPLPSFSSSHCILLYLCIRYDLWNQWKPSFSISLYKLFVKNHKKGLEVANIVAINFTIVIPKILKPKRDRFRDAYPPDYLSPMISTFFFAPFECVFDSITLFIIAKDF